MWDTLQKVWAVWHDVLQLCCCTTNELIVKGWTVFRGEVAAGIAMLCYSVSFGRSPLKSVVWNVLYEVYLQDKAIFIDDSWGKIRWGLQACRGWCVHHRLVVLRLKLGLRVLIQLKMKGAGRKWSERPHLLVWRNHVEQLLKSEQCHCSKHDRRQWICGCSIFHSHHEKSWENICVPQLCVIFTLVKHAGVRGQTDLSEPLRVIGWPLWKSALHWAQICFGKSCRNHIVFHHHCCVWQVGDVKCASFCITAHVL